MSTSFTSSKRSRSAFTLIELTIVLLVMALLAAVAAPSYFRTINHQHVTAGATRLKADLELARHQAMQISSVVTVAFDVGDSSYQMPPMNGLAGGVAAKSVVNLNDEPYHCEMLTAVFGGKPWVSFDRFGMPHSVGAVRLLAGSHERSVSVNSNGEVRVIIIVAEDPVGSATGEATPLSGAGTQGVGI